MPEKEGKIGLWGCTGWYTNPDDWRGGGSYTLVLDNVPDMDFMCSFIIRPLVLGDNCHCHFQLYIEGVLTYDLYRTVAIDYSNGSTNYDWSPFIFFFRPPFYSDFEFTTAQYMCRNGISGLNIFPFHSQDCSIHYNTLSPNDLITISITSGSEYVAIIKNSNYNKASSSQSYSLSENAIIELWQYKPISGTDPVNVTIKAEVNGIEHENSLQILPPKYNIKVYYSNSYVVHNNISEINIQTEDPYCNSMILPDDTKYNIKIISGDNFGKLVDPTTGQSASELTGLSHDQGNLSVNFVANGDIPLHDDLIEIQISTSDPSIDPVTITLPIKPASLAAAFTTDVLCLGDTTVVHVKQLLSDGTTEEIPGQLFYVSIIQGRESATLIDPSTNNIGNQQFGISNDFYVVSADNISADSLLVKLYINTFNESPPLGAVKYNGDGIKKPVEKENTDALKIPGKNVIAKKTLLKGGKRLADKINTIESKNSNPSSSGKYKKISEYYGDFSVVAEIPIKNPELEIIYPTKKDNDEKITAEPKMPKVTCEAKLNNYKKGAVTFEWEYKVSYELKRKDTKGNSAAINDAVTNWEVPFKKTGAEFLYTAKHFKEKYGGCESLTNQWTDGEDVFIGGKVNVKLIAKNENRQIISQLQQDINSIIGLNPDPVQVKSGLTLQEQVSVYMESMPKWKHFNEFDRDKTYNKLGNACYGPPGGFGLMQIDEPPISEMGLWNWYENLQIGKTILNGKKISAISYPSRVKSGTTWFRTKKGKIIKRDPINIEWYPNKYYNANDFTSDEGIWKETFQRYNGGTYWVWVPDNPNEKRNPNCTGQWKQMPVNNYGNTAWEYYKQVISGNYPENWN